MSVVDVLDPGERIEIIGRRGPGIVEPDFSPAPVEAPVAVVVRPVEPRAIGPRPDRYRGQATGRLVALSVLFALMAALAAGVGFWRGGLIHVTAAALWFVSGALAYRAQTIALRCSLDPTQRAALRGRLGGLTPLAVRVAAVSAPESISYARDLRNLIGEADWPVVGVYKRRGEDDADGMALAVRNILAPPAEAIALLDTLRRVGIRIAWAHKPALGDDRTIEIQVGRL